MTEAVQVLGGRPHPLGATWDGRGVHFALFSEHATAVELCLFDPAQAHERVRLPLGRSGDVWHGYVPGAAPGSLYGYRVHGPWDPSAGHRFDPSKLLVDPYARALTGPVRWDEALLSRPPGASTDSAPFVPRCVVVDPSFDWGDDEPPRTPWDRTLLYECHVRGMTRLHADVPEAMRGRFAALATEPVVEHLRSLGVTALCLLPVQHAAVDPHLGRLGRANYWGYATLGFFAPDARFASAGDPVREFQQMVKALHAAGIEVILDVVYNHTPEGGTDGSTLSLRGIDNAAYYRSPPGRPGEVEDFTGCGNTPDLRHPRVLELVLESLRYWVRAMHVDGFRFDLAPALARTEPEVDPAGPFFEAVRRDPVLSAVKRIAEPWDLGPDPDQQGAFPPGWREWNGRYRDAVRRFWRGDPGRRAELATRLCGSDDLFGAPGRGPLASVNFVTCHDGFTLEDLVSYERKHNEANGEENRDGHDDNASSNWGVEGPTRDPQILARREQAKRSLVATLALSLGVPMLSHGDELGRTQRGNNNAYCQDGPTTWLHWELDTRQRAFLAFVRRVFALRRDLPVFRRSRFFASEDVRWLAPDGRALDQGDWSDPASSSLALWIPAPAGAPPRSELLLLLNASPSAEKFALPEPASRWRELLDTAVAGERPVTDGAVELAPFSLRLLESPPAP